MENQGKCVEYEGQCMKVCDCDKCKIRNKEGTLRLTLTYLFVLSFFVIAVVAKVLGVF